MGWSADGESGSMLKEMSNSNCHQRKQMKRSVKDDEMANLDIKMAFKQRIYQFFNEELAPR
jgi:hypothetical protein